jgi:5-hydroxyisourate hydrolase
MRMCTQVLDGTFGKPAAGVSTHLERMTSQGWITMAVAETNNAGGIKGWDDITLEHGVYRLVFDGDSYFVGLGGVTAYPEVIIIFRVPNEYQACQVKVILAPYSYTTYFGSTDRQPHDHEQA